MPKRKSSNGTKASTKGTQKNSLVANINKRRKSHTSRSRKDSTVSSKAFKDMKEGWPSKKKSAKTKSGTKTSAKKSSKKKRSESESSKKTSKKSKSTAKASRNLEPTQDPH